MFSFPLFLFASLGVCIGKKLEIVFLFFHILYRLQLNKLIM